MKTGNEWTKIAISAVMTAWLAAGPAYDEWPAVSDVTVFSRAHPGPKPDHSVLSRCCRPVEATDNHIRAG